MAYIGKEPAVGNFQVCDAISVVNGQAAYTMQVSSTNVVPESANHMLVSLNGILQKPNSSFTVSGSTITFASNLATGDVIDFIMLLGNVLDIGTPSDSTVTDAKANFVSTSSAAGLQIKGDGTTDGTLQLNCSQNSHGIKLASPAHSASQSYKLIFPSGNVTAGKFLKVDSVSGSGTTGVGTMTFGDAGGGMTLLANGSVTSTTSQLQIDGTYVTDTYEHYKLYFSGRITNDSASVNLRYRNSANSGLITSGYGLAIKNLGASDDQLRSDSYSQLELFNRGNPGNNTNEGFNLVLDFMSPRSNSVPTVCFWKCGAATSSDQWIVQSGGGRRNDGTEVHTGFTIYCSAGDFSEFEYQFYGLQKS